MKKAFLLLMILCMLTASVGCNVRNTAQQETESDVALEAPSVDITKSDSEEETTRDYGDKQVVNGFWVKQEKSGNETYYLYIPMMTTKLAGIFDFEDGEDRGNYVDNIYSNYNCPAGAGAASLKGKNLGLCYYSNAQLGFNSNPEDEKIVENEKERYVESFAVVTDDNINTVYSYDVGCVTFALYKDLYESFPDMKLQIYGVTNELINENVGDIKTCDTKAYKKFLKQCLTGGMVDCELLGEKDITDSGIFYVDYKALSEKGDYIQFMLVLSVSETTGFAYFMDTQGCYNITNQEQYAKWKEEHISQFIAG